MLQPGYHLWMASYREQPPDKRLQSVVQSCWLLHDTAETAEPQRVVPDGHAELILNLGAPFEAFREGRWHRQPRTFLAGQIDGPLLLRPTGPAHIIGIRLQPHGAARLFGARMQETSGRFVRLDDLSPKFARDCERALDSPDPTAHIQAAIAPALRYSNDPAIESALQQIHAARGCVDIAGLARASGLSTRQFERRFLDRVGLPPKLFCRMQRFVHVFGRMSKPGGDWVQAALNCGYCDQSHLIRDCKVFSGTTPADLLAPDADLARHFYERFGMSHSSKTTAARLR